MLRLIFTTSNVRFALFIINESQSRIKRAFYRFLGACQCFRPREHFQISRYTGKSDTKNPPSRTSHPVNRPNDRAVWKRHFKHQFQVWMTVYSYWLPMLRAKLSSLSRAQNIKSLHLISLGNGLCSLPEDSSKRVMTMRGSVSVYEC